MHNVSQQQAAEASPVTATERASFWRDRRFGNMEWLTADVTGCAFLAVLQTLGI